MVFGWFFMFCLCFKSGFVLVLDDGLLMVKNKPGVATRSWGYSLIV